MLEWNPNALPTLVAGGLGVAFAVVVVATRPSRTQNRFLGAYLFSFGVFNIFWFAFRLMWTNPDVARAAGFLASPIILLMTVLYLFFLGTIESPWRAFLRHPATRWTTILIAATLTASIPFVPELWIPEVVANTYIGGWDYPETGILRVRTLFYLMLFYFLAFGVAFTAWRTAKTPYQRSFSGSLVLAFGVHDAAIALWVLHRLAGHPVTGPRGDELLLFYFPGFTTFWLVTILTYAMLRDQVLDIDLRVSRGLRVALIALVAGGAITAAIALAIGVGLQGVKLALFASFVGLLALACIRPANRLAIALAERAFQSARSAGFFGHRKVRVYQAACEQLVGEGVSPHVDQPFLAELRANLALPRAAHGPIASSASTSGVRPRHHLAEAELPPGFTNVRALGGGAQGFTWLARGADGREVVIKRPAAQLGDEATAAIFVEDARRLRAIRHPNVIRVFSVEQDERGPFMVMEYAARGDLGQRLHDIGPLARADAHGNGRDILAGLAALHSGGLVHGDLKPSNVLRAEDGRFLVSDPGPRFDTLGLDADLVAAIHGAAGGSLGYMSPEQARGVLGEPRSDVYSAGAVLFEALTGVHYLRLRRLPYYVARRRIQEIHPDLEDPRVPDAVRGVLAQALAKDAGSRFRGPGAMQAAWSRAWEREGLAS